MIRKIKRLNEEIARWAFEININNLPNWEIIFTNPTAGPWKKIMCNDELGNKREIYRFQLEEERPDIIMINDELKLIVIIEAKDSLEKLLDSKQLLKTVNVTEEMAGMLKKNRSEYWRKNDYTTILGMLWGAEEKSDRDSVEKLFQSHLEEVQKKNNICNTVLFGIETLYNSEDRQIKCISHYYGEDVKLIMAIEESFHDLFSAV